MERFCRTRSATSILYFRSPLRCVFALLLLAVLGESNVVRAVQPVRNVVLIVADDLKASVLGCYGDSICRTPNIDRLAQQGVLFENAYCQGVVCGPSRRSFMFSRYKGKAALNLGQCFRDAGHYSARVGKIYHMRVPGDIIAGTDGEDELSSWTERFNAPGLEAHTPGDYACLNLNIFSRSLAHRESTQTKNRMFVTVEYDGDGSDQADHKAASKAIELLQTHAAEPFFLAVGFVRPHYPMVAPREYFSPYPYQEMKLPEMPADDYADIPKIGLAGTRNNANPIGKYPDNQRRMWTGYYASVSFMDHQVGRILDELERLQLRDNTAIVFISDHGYHLGEHGFWQKANLHDDVIRVPMVIAAPGVAAARCDSIVELVDVFPTVTDLAGLGVPPSVQGQSLKPLLMDPTQTVRKGALSFSKGVSYREKDWHLIRYNNEELELYDMQNDPQQFSNLATQPKYQRKLNELLGALDARMDEAGLQ